LRNGGWHRGDTKKRHPIRKRKRRTTGLRKVHQRRGKEIERTRLGRPRRGGKVKNQTHPHAALKAPTNFTNIIRMLSIKLV